MTRLVAIGTPFANDSIALRLVRLLEPELRALCSELEIDYCESPGQELLSRLDAKRPTLLVDALAGAGADGAVIAIDPAALLENPRPLSTHEVSVAGVLQLAQSLGQLPRQLAVLGIAADPGSTLSTEAFEHARSELRDKLGALLAR